MKPVILGLPMYYTLWLVAAVCGIGAGRWLTRRAGLPGRSSLQCLLLVAVGIFVGSKLLFLLEQSTVAHWAAQPSDASTSAELAHGFRLPGGILLAAILLPAYCRFLSLPLRRYADAFVPCVGIAIFFLRIGCFLRGCCFGARTDGAFGVAFPAGSLAFEHQLLQHDIGWRAEQALPVHPLELYFAAVGLVMFLLGLRWQRRAHVDGEVWAKELMLFFASTFVLEFVRAVPFPLNMVLTAGCFVVVGAWLVRLRKRAVAIATA